MAGRSDRVVIIGAGPTGVLLAIELARRGVEVRVLDKQPSRSTESRAIALHARTLEAFHQLGIVDEFLELGHRVMGGMLHTRARRTARARFGGLDTPYPFMLTLPQNETQRILDQRLERLGVTIERAVTAVDLRQHADGVEIDVTRGGGRRERPLAADWVVGCDGAHSLVRRRLGVPFDGEDYGQDWLMTEANVDWQIELDYFHVFSYATAPLAAFPLPSGRWRVFLPQVPNRAGERQPPDMAEIDRLVAQRGPIGMRLTNPTLLTAFRCYRRSTNIMRHGRVLVAGDAAHIHSPAGGQGMNTGLHDAFNLGWKLALVAHGQSPPALLDTYQGERAPIAARVLALTHDLVMIFTVASRPRRWLRDRLLPTLLAVPAAERRFTARMAQLSHTYRGGPLAASTPRTERKPLAAGDRLPNVNGLTRDGTTVSTLDLLSAPAHTLLVLTGTRAQSDLARDAIARLARWNGLVEGIAICGPAGSDNPHAVSDPDLRAHRRYHAMRGALLLIRPDGHLASRAPLNRPDIPERYLQQLDAGGQRGERRSKPVRPRTLLAPPVLNSARSCHGDTGPRAPDPAAGSENRSKPRPPPTDGPSRRVAAEQPPTVLRPGYANSSTKPSSHQRKEAAVSIESQPTIQPRTRAARHPVALRLGATALTLVLAALTLAHAARAAGWALQPTPNATGFPQTFLTGVSCPSRIECAAVGYAQFASATTTFDGLDELWNGTSWKLAFGQRLAASANNAFTAVSCAGASSCEAVGYYEGSGGMTLPLAEVWNGSSWTVQPAQLPAGATSALLFGVSCTSPSACTAVGWSLGAHALVERWDGISWTVQQSLPASNSPLSSVSCASASSCVAVGSSGLGNFAEAWDGTTWRTVLLGIFNGASFSELDSVSCTSANACIAVGRYAKAGMNSTLGLSWNGSTWVLRNTPNLSATFNVLGAVSCASAGACKAVGEWTDFRGERLTLAESWDGFNWSYEATPNPPGINPALDGVSCSSATACTAVGQYENSSGNTLTLAERFSGGSGPHGLSLTRRGDVLALLRKPRALELLVFKLGRHGRLLGSVALGRHPQGRSRIRWNLHVAGRWLAPGTYVAELVAALGRGATTNGPAVTFTVNFPTGPIRVLSSTCSVPAAASGRC